MLTIFFGICIYGMAERELRRGWLWGPVYCLGSALVQTTLIAGYWGAVLSLLLAIAAMTWANDQKRALSALKGPSTFQEQNQPKGAGSSSHSLPESASTTFC